MVKQEELKIVGFVGTTADDGAHEITHAEMSDGTTIPADEITPRMWAAAGLSVPGQPEH
jgi:hypothetical protein